IFDDEGCLSAPLLDPKQTARHKAYRKAYAELLYLWHLQIPRLEILKFNGLRNHFHTNGHPANSAHFAPTAHATDLSASSVPASVPAYNGSPSQSELLLTLGRSSRSQKLLNDSLLGAASVDVVGHCVRCRTRLRPSISEMTGVGGRC